MNGVVQITGCKFKVVWWVPSSFGPHSVTPDPHDWEAQARWLPLSPCEGYCLPLPDVPNWKSFLNHKPITPPAPTYRDIIKEAKRQFAKNQKDLRM